MGQSLKLLPFEGVGNAVENYSQTVLTVERRITLFEQIGFLESDLGRRVPEQFNTYLCRDDDETPSHYGNTQETAEGEELWCLEAWDLLTVRHFPGVLDNSMNRAVWAYLECLDPQTKVALYWH